MTQTFEFPAINSDTLNCAELQVTGPGPTFHRLKLGNTSLTLNTQRNRVGENHVFVC